MTTNHTTRQKVNRRYNRNKYKTRRRQHINNTASSLTSSSKEDQSQPSTVINLSDHNLSDAEISLLSKGISFCPTPSQIDHFQLQADLNELKRKMYLKVYYSSKQSQADQLNNTTIHPTKDSNNTQDPHSQMIPTQDTDAPSDSQQTYRCPSGRNKWIPNINNPRLQLFMENVERDVNEAATKYETNRYHDNLSRQERQALESLRSNPNIVIKPADKGSAIVVMSSKDYIDEGIRQLSDVTTYQKLDKDLTDQHLQLVKQTIDTLDEDKKVKRNLIPTNASCPNMYFLPKIHKPNNPGRPIVSGCSCPTVEISKYLDFHLRPLVTRLPSYLQDTTDFLNHIDNLNKSHAPLPERTILVTADVKFYTNIPHNEGIQACKMH
nr:uncharacterized protein LOC129255931 [Lytechinus pictus]